MSRACPRQLRRARVACRLRVALLRAWPRRRPVQPSSRVLPWRQAPVCSRVAAAAVPCGGKAADVMMTRVMLMVMAMMLMVILFLPAAVEIGRVSREQ